ncbi:10646_t:CDS:1 [Rhizophagus irregularis]|nr:10646_t:CDS:1 [Rhizophagus irregularis]
MHRGHHALSNKNGKNVDRNVPMRNSSHGSLDDSIHCARGRSETKKRIHVGIMCYSIPSIEGQDDLHFLSVLEEFNPK